MKIWIWSYSQCRMCEWRRGDVCCGSMRDGIRCGGVVECCCCADGCCGGAANQGQNQPSADCTGLRVQLGTLIHCSVLQQQLQQLSIMMTAVNNNIISSCVPTITACELWLLSQEFQSTSKFYPLTNDARPRQRQGISTNLSPNTMTLLQTMSSDNKRVQWNFPSQYSESLCLRASVRSEERAVMAGDSRLGSDQDTGKLQCPYTSL